jgi:hypothetical protein
MDLVVDFFVFFHSQNFSTTSNYTIVEGDYMSLAGPYSIGMAHEVLLLLSIRYVILHAQKLLLGFLNIAQSLLWLLVIARLLNKLKWNLGQSEVGDSLERKKTFANKRKINAGRKNEMHQKLRDWKRQRTQQLENFDERKTNLEPKRTIES